MFDTIAILTHEHDSDIKESGYFLAYLIRAWEAQGIRVHISRSGKFIPADVAILHVDSTVVQSKYLELAARYPIAVNGNLGNVSRSLISGNLLTRKALWKGRVIVKTDANYGAIPEFKMAVQKGTVVPGTEAVQRPWKRLDHIEPAHYPVFNTLNDVPWGVWQNPRLVVEKFLPEVLETGEYMLRTYLFFGEQEHGMWYTSNDPVVKFSNSNHMGLLDCVPESLREQKRAAGFGFGRFDYTMVDGQAVVFDWNKTPVTGAQGQKFISARKMQAFAAAIMDFEEKKE